MFETVTDSWRFSALLFSMLVFVPARKHDHLL